MSDEAQQPPIAQRVAEVDAFVRRAESPLPPGQAWLRAARAELGMPEPIAPIRYVTNSEIQVFKDCRRKWWLRHVRRLKRIYESPVGASPLGTIVHAALEALYRSLYENTGRVLDPIAVVRQIVAFDTYKVTDDKVADVLKQGELAEIMVEGYMEWLAETGADEDLETIAVERSVEVEYTEIAGRRVKLLGKLDEIVRRRSSGARLFKDHKSVQEMTTPTRTLHLNEQMMHYHLLQYLDLLARGVDPKDEAAEGGLYNMLRKVKRTTKANPPFYQREEVRHNLASLRSYWQRVYFEIRDILAAEDEIAANPEQASSIAYPRPSRDCPRCTYFLICPQFDDGSDVEHVIRSYYTEADPLERYADDEGDE